MSKVNFVRHDGTVREISVMLAAVRNGTSEIEGQCAGCLDSVTGHVDATWISVLPSLKSPFPIKTLTVTIPEVQS
jgi:hypothetical protein